MFFGFLALGPILERDEEEGAVGIRHLAQQAIADDGAHVLDARRRLDQFFGLAGDLRGALQRRGIGKLDSGKEITLVFIGQEAGGYDFAEEADAHGDGRQEDETNEASADGDPADTDVTAGHPGKHPVEAVVELLQRAAALHLRLEQHGAKRRAQRQRVERRDDHRDGDGDRELLVELAGDAGNEGGRHENRSQDHGDCDHRTGDLFHGPELRFLGRHAMLDMVLDRLDDDDGIVNYQTDGQHQAKQRQRIDREAEQREEHESADQRYRHRQQRDQRRPPALQEDEDDDDDQHQRLDQGVLDFLDALGHRQRGIEGDDIVKVGREALLDLFHQLLGAVGRFQGIGARHQVEGDESGRLAVEPTLHAVGLGAKFDTGNIPDTDNRAIRIGAQHDATEVLLALQPPLGAYRVGELLTLRHRFGPDGPCGIDRVLRVDRVDDLRDRYVELGQLVGLDPQPHRILAGAEHGDAGDALDPRHLVVDVDVRIIGEEDVVVGAVRRVEREHEQRR